MNAEESEEMTIEKAIKEVVEIGLRFEKQLELAEEAARVERKRKDDRASKGTNDGR